MTQHSLAVPAEGADLTTEVPETPRKKRVFLWVFLAVQALFLVWVIAGAKSGAGAAAECSGLYADTCRDATEVGTALGVAALITFWAVVDIILGVSYGVYKLSKRS